MCVNLNIEFFGLVIKSLNMFILNMEFKFR